MTTKLVTLTASALILAGALYQGHVHAVSHAYGCGQMSAVLEDGPDPRFPKWFPAVEIPHFAR